MQCPDWLPQLHRELICVAYGIGVRPREECSCLADESLTLTLIKLPQDALAHESRPSVDFRRLSYRITQNLAVDHLRREMNQPSSFSALETGADEEGNSIDPADDSPNVGHDLEQMDEQFSLRVRIKKACARVRRRTRSFVRRRYIRAVIDTFLDRTAPDEDVPTGREVGRILIEHGYGKPGDKPYPENAACDVLYDVFEALGGVPD